MPCAIIPVYNHGPTAGAVVGSLAVRNLPVILVDDASNAETKAALARIVSETESCFLYTLPVNLGKGGAVSHGLRKAFESGFTHALQIDADGQHDLGQVDAFMKYAQLSPGTLVGGMPQYDDSVPKARLIGRGITNFWVMVETLSRDIPDAMCGFRVYPLAACNRLLTTKRLRRRMEFDIEFLVRLHWRGVRMKFIPVKVIYPEGGISHFRMFQDNIAISLMHTQLFFGMILRLPILLARKIKKCFVREAGHVALV
ncbi:MAG: glycosyltransferase family 2 protein [Spirochaetaceae bacterium]|nr:MAG: glycosyltransferase family 2 protein [Spirochaetaceae bacterium]